MSTKRRDNKNRILQNGESQRKDLRYMYKYIDNAGRDKIKILQRDLEAGLILSGGDMTVLELVQKYIAQKTGVRENTRVGYNFVINILKKGVREQEN